MSFGIYTSNVSVVASRLRSPFAWTSGRGSSLLGLVGDWLLTCGDDSWTVTDDHFKAMYKPWGDGMWRKDVRVRAQQVDHAVEVDTPEGSSRAKRRDWILTVDGVGSWPIDDHTFQARYERVDEL